jgi:TonB family protein
MPAAPAPARSAASTGRVANATGAGLTDADVTHQEMPDPSRSARETIHGHIKISVRLTVDASGKVSNAELQDPGPSKYFSRLALAAASKWTFAGGGEARPALVHFDFSRDGVSGHAGS